MFSRNEVIMAIIIALIAAMLCMIGGEFLGAIL